MDLPAMEKLRQQLTPLPEGQFLLGLSGGADSVALLLMLLPDQISGRIRLEAVHVNHGLRGREAEEDARFAGDLCRRLHIPFHLFEAQLGSRRDENAAREARYSCFRDCMARTGADGLILAHHADDLAETLLMRLIRGTGPEGLTAMKAEAEVMGIRILRPMLALRREEIRDALRADGQPWREDASNQETIYLRNGIRKEIMPRLEVLAPGAGARMARTAALLEADSRTLQQEAAALLRQAETGPCLDTEILAGKPEAITSRVLRLWCERRMLPRKQRGLSMAETGKLLELLRGAPGTVNLPGGLRVRRGQRWMYPVEPAFSGSETVLWQGPETIFGAFRLRESTGGTFPGDGKRIQAVPARFAEGCVIRTRRPGDRITPYGSPGSRKLQDYLTDRKVEACWRDRIPLLCRGSEVLLAAGIGAGRIPRLTEPGKDTVTLEWIGPMPWMENTGMRSTQNNTVKEM